MELRSQRSVHAFDMHVCVCPSCGYSFNSPAPSAKDLLEYYQSVVPYNQGVTPHYAVEKRLEVIGGLCGRDAVIAEVGGNDAVEFHSRLRERHAEVLALEPNLGVASGQRAVSALAAGAADLVCHYDVLEHVIDVGAFLYACREGLTPGGHMVVEVPDARMYPRSLTLLSPEHVNHFTPESLARLAGVQGFELERVSYAASSRPYSFLAVFRKGEAPAAYEPVRDLALAADARACIEGGVARIEALRASMAELRERIASVREEGGQVVLWCATYILQLFLEDFALPNGVSVVDADEKKGAFFEHLGIQVDTPPVRQEEIANCALLAVFSPRSGRTILADVRTRYNAAFPEEAFVVLGTGEFGEPL